MSSGGMDWAYRMISAHKLDPLAVAVVLHLGWRDHPDFRTDRGIARALGGRDRRTIRDCTAKLCKLGIIVRRSSQWVAVETVSIVEETSAAPRPSASFADGRGCQAPSPDLTKSGGGVRPPRAGVSGPPKRGCEAPLKRREKKEKGGGVRIAAVSPSRSPVARPMVGGSGGSVPAVSDLSEFQRARVLSGQSVLVGGVLLPASSAELQALRHALRLQSA